MAMKQHVWFGAFFLLMSTAGALLLTWSVWWLAVVGESMPARRPFFASSSEVPALVANTPGLEKSTDVFKNVLPGGWPTVNSAVRLVAAIFAVIASFTFAFIATLAHEKTTRYIFTGVLFITTISAIASTALDTLSLTRTVMECRKRECVTFVPKFILSSAAKCTCAPDGWFWVTLGVDAVLLVSAFTCLVLTLKPLFKKR